MSVQDYYLYIGTPLMGGAVTFAVGTALHYGSEFYRSFKERRNAYQLEFDLNRTGDLKIFRSR